MKEWIPWVISLSSLLYTGLRNGRKDQAETIKKEDEKFQNITESLIKVNMKLDQLCSTTSETRTDIKALNNDMNSMNIRVTALERDLKTAFSIIEELKERVNKYEN